VDPRHLNNADRANFEFNRLKAINDVRSALLGGLGMVVTAVGAVAVFCGRVAYLNYREAQRQNREAASQPISAERAGEAGEIARYHWGRIIRHP
jgi:hypothetical protein